MKKYFYIKCILDFICALSAILVFWPILLVIAILIKLESKGPVFFRQERLGRNGNVFKIYKFRTMVDGAINLGSGLRTDEGDPRITKTGNFLRKTSLDELPQVFNILRGEMSFIGPRPPVPYYPRKYEDYSTEQKRRFKIRSGISGYAQVILRNSGTWDQRIKLDLEYVDKMSLLFDIYIVLKTIYSVVRSDNIYLTEDIKEYVPKETKEESKQVAKS